MKVGKSNKLDDLSSEVIVSGTVASIPGFEEENLIDALTLKLYAFPEGAATTTIDWTTGITADIICLFNITIKTDVEIKTYDTSDVLIESATFTNNDSVGFQYKNILFELTDTTTPIGKVELVFTTSDSNFITKIGYFWIGDLVDFGCAEQIQAFDESNDQVSITRANSPDTNVEYNFQRYNATLKKEETFDNVRAKFRTFWELGFSNPRPFLLDEPLFSSTELLYGIFDAPTVAYDTFNLTNPSELTQSTIGIREVF